MRDIRVVFTIDFEYLQIVQAAFLLHFFQKGHMDCDDNSMPELFDGRYGPYVSDGKSNASLPKGMDQDKITAEEKFDGKFVLQTNTDLHWKDVVHAYKDLWQVEAAFRTLKNELAMGPVYHSAERRIRAHIFICFLALVLKLSLQKKLISINPNVTFSKVLEDLKKIKAVNVTVEQSEYILRTELTGDAHYAFKAAGLKIPPRLLNDPPRKEEIVVLCP